MSLEKAALFCRPTGDEAKEQARKEWVQLLGDKRRRAIDRFFAALRRLDPSDKLLVLDSITFRGDDQGG